jgi:hypothetical protein
MDQSTLLLKYLKLISFMTSISGLDDPLLMYSKDTILNACFPAHETQDHRPKLMDQQTLLIRYIKALYSILPETTTRTS